MLCAPEAVCRADPSAAPGATRHTSFGGRDPVNGCDTLYACRKHKRRALACECRWPMVATQSPTQWRPGVACWRYGTREAMEMLASVDGQRLRPSRRCEWRPSENAQHFARCENCEKLTTAFRRCEWRPQRKCAASSEKTFGRAVTVTVEGNGYSIVG